MWRAPGNEASLRGDSFVQASMMSLRRFPERHEFVWLLLERRRFGLEATAQPWQASGEAGVRLRKRQVGVAKPLVPKSRAPEVKLD